MIRKFSPAVLTILILAIVYPAQAQQAKKVPRIGFLVPGSSVGYSVRIEAFRQGMRELGYVEGKNIVIEGRWAEGGAGRFPPPRRELVRLKVDAVVFRSAAGSLAAKSAGFTAPGVFAAVTAPLGYGIIG